jgi:hypothetical protein
MAIRLGSNQLVAVTAGALLLGVAAGLWIARDDGTDSSAAVPLSRHSAATGDSSPEGRTLTPLPAAPATAETAANSPQIEALSPSEIVARLRRKELRFGDLEALPQALRDEVGLEIAKGQFAEFSEERRESELREILRLEVVGRAGAAPDPSPSAEELGRIRERFEKIARPLAEEALSEIELDMRTKWERGEGVNLWHDGEPPAMPHRQDGPEALFSTTGSGQFGFGINVAFTYSTRDTFSVESKLQRIRDLKREALEEWLRNR